MLPLSETTRFRPKVQAVVRIFSAVVRLIPLDLTLFREFLILGSEAFREYKFIFNFRSLRLNIMWSAKGFPDRLTRHMMFHGVYQDDVLTWIRRYCKKGDIVFDVGAFHGLMTVVASKVVGPRGRVVAFEPNPDAREHLNNHINLNKCRNVTVEPVGLMDYDGSADFYSQVGDVTWNSSFVRKFVDPDHNLAAIEVPCTSIDAYVKKTELIPNFIKVDTEGTEFLVLKGVRQTLKRHKPILVFELNPMSAVEAGTSISEIVADLEGLSYVLKVIRPTRWGRYKLKNEERFQESVHAPGDLVNVICIPQKQ